ncbi:MAG TPA: glycosyltransferase [Armatimonadota bacterium]|nr:glycosyltransferase [Armatimonadota bacterium]
MGKTVTAIMSPIRLAFIVESAVGGVARHIIDLATHLNSDEFSCTIYASLQRPESWTNQLHALTEHGITLREIPMARIPNASAVKQIRGWLERDAIDIVHLHSAKAGYLGRIATEPLGLPIIYTPHAFPFQRTTDWRRPIYRLIERRLAPLTQKIICVSSGEYYEALLAGLPEQKLTIINNGIDVERWPRPTEAQRREARAQYRVAQDEVVIGTMARLVPQKGIDLLLAAAEEFLPDFPNAKLLVWGNGPQFPKLKRMARSLRLNRVQFLGETTSPWHAYAAMDIFCAPSRWEAGPYAILEAMACGLPIVASEVAGHIDYLEDGESGLIISPELPGPLDGAIRTLLIDADRRADLGRAAHRRAVYEFPIEKMVAETTELYRSVYTRKASLDAESHLGNNKKPEYP